MRTSALLVFPGVIALAHIGSWQLDVFYVFSEQYYWTVSFSVFLFFLFYSVGRVLLSRKCAGVISAVIARLYLGDRGSNFVFLGLFFVFSLLNAVDRFLIIGPWFFSPDRVMDFRILMTMEGGSNIIKGISLGNFFIFLLPTFILANGKNVKGFLRYFSLIIFSFDIYLTSARASLFISVLIAFYFLVLPKRIGIGMIFRIFLLILALLILFELISIIVGKSTEELSFLVYLSGPLHAFDQLLNDPSLLSGYFLSFFPIQMLFSLLEILPLIGELPNVATPLLVNVYTIFGVYFNDFGFFGLFVWMSIFGVLSGVLEKIFYWDRSNAIQVYVAINLTILSLSIFHDYYTTSAVIWISLVLTPLFFGQKSGEQYFLPRKIKF